ncbi:MAG: hypothetical protein AB7Q17_00185 [Phycisphaerae bacterium]
MAPFSRVVFIALLIAGLAMCGCDRSQPPSTAFNAVLGDLPSGAPVRTPPVDAGILKDLSTYQPAPPPAGAGAAIAGGASIAGGDAQSEVKAALLDVVKAAIRGDIDVALDAFNADHVAALKADTSVLLDTYDKVARLVRGISEKLGQPIDLKDPDALFARIAPGQDLFAGVVVEVTDPDTAHVGAPQEALAAVMGTMGGIPGVGAAPSADQRVTLVRQDGKWRIQLPKPITAEEAAQANRVLKALHPIIDKLTDQVDQADIKSPQDLQALMMGMLPELMTVMAELQGELGSGLDPETRPTDDGDAAAPAPDEPPPPAEPPPAPIGSGGRRGERP